MTKKTKKFIKKKKLIETKNKNLKAKSFVYQTDTKITRLDNFKNYFI